MGATCCREEFRLKNFGFRNCDAERFYRSQWSKSRWIFLGIKLILMLYWLGWYVAGFVVTSNVDRWWIFLTNWGVTLLLIYFLSSFALACYGVITKEEDVSTISSNVETISGSITKRDETRNVQFSLEELRWFHIFVWIFHEVSFAMALFITIAYWSLLDANLSSFSINNHLINLIIMLVDLFLCDIPIRFLHFYHVSLGGVVYTVFSLILHGTGYTSAIYPVFNWATGTGIAIATSLLSIFVGTPIAHFIGYGLYHLRWFIARKCGKDQNDTWSMPEPSMELGGRANVAYSD